MVHTAGYHFGGLNFPAVFPPVGDGPKRALDDASLRIEVLNPRLIQAGLYLRPPLVLPMSVGFSLQTSAMSVWRTQYSAAGIGNAAKNNGKPNHDLGNCAEHLAN